MKVCLLTLMLGALPLAACTMNNGSIETGIARPAPGATKEDVGSNGFIKEKNLTAQEYADQSKALKKPKACGETPSFKAYALGDEFLIEKKLIVTEDAKTQQLYSRLKSKVMRVQEDELSWLDTFEKFDISGLKGAPLKDGSNESLRTCARKEGVLTCEGGPQLSDEANKYIDAHFSEDPKEECQDVYQEVAKDVVIHAQGFFKLKNEKKIRAFLERKERKVTRQCKNSADSYAEITEAIVSDSLKSSSGDDCVSPMVSLYKSISRKSLDGKKSVESVEMVLGAPLR